MSANESTTRREFLEFVGRSALAASALGSLPLLAGCKAAGKSDALISSAFKASFAPLQPLQPSSADQLGLAEGLRSQIILRWDDAINSQERFGTNSDYIAFFPLNEAGTDGILWNNHESLNPALVHGEDLKGPKTREQVMKEQLSVGGSLVRIRKDAVTGEWKLVKNDPLNRRVSGRTMIPIVAERPIEGKTEAMGTLGNCAGGITPWGTLLTCEENYDNFYGETHVKEDGSRSFEKSRFGWEKFFPNPPEHYGWVVEVNPLTGAAKKLTSLGRYAHECATLRPLPDGRVVAYSGDDGENRCLYKFVSDTPHSLETGTLYVANVEQGRWIPLVHEANAVLATSFADQTEVLIRCREASLMIGGSRLARPEDIEVDPVTGAVFVSLTANTSRGDLFGSILKIEERDNDPAALEFKASTFLAGSSEAGFACPDNLAFDRNGNLWMTTDVSGSKMNKAPFDKIKNNGLFYIPLSGDHAGKVFRVANAPTDAEFTGPFFAPDGKTLFLSVQHPGEESKSVKNLTSHWPDGGDSLPRSAVIAITGPTLDRLLSGPGVKPIFELPILKPN